MTVQELMDLLQKNPDIELYYLREFENEHGYFLDVRIKKPNDVQD